MRDPHRPQDLKDLALRNEAGAAACETMTGALMERDLVAVTPQKDAREKACERSTMMLMRSGFTACLRCCGRAPTRWRTRPPPRIETVRRAIDNYTQV